MSASERRAGRIPWPPLIYLAAIAAAILLGLAYPLPWIGTPLGDILFAIGWLLVAGFLAMTLGAIRALGKAGTTVLPTREAEALVTSGPFAISRNPIYLGNTMLLAGIGFITGSVWFLILAIVAGFLTQKLAIEPEEKHMAARFGKKYRDYRKKVRRWF